MDIAIEKLKSAELLQELESTTKEVVSYDAVEDAKWFLSNVAPVIEKNKAQLIAAVSDVGYARYYQLVVLNKWLVFSLLRDEECVDLFRNYFSYVFELPENIDLWQKIKGKLQAMHYVEDRDEFKRKLVRALMENKEVITTNKLDIGGKSELGEIGVWLRDYASAVGGGRVDNLKREEYLIKSKNAKSLSNEEREKLTFLTGLVERLKLSSAEAKGLEDPVMTLFNDKLVTLKDGTFEPIDPKIVQIMKKMKEKGLIDEIPESITGGLSAVALKSSAEKERVIDDLVKHEIKPQGEIKSEGETKLALAERKELVGEPKRAEEPSLASTSALQQKYAEFITGPLIESVVKRSDEIKRQLGAEIKALRNEFYRSVNALEKEDAAAALFVIFRAGQAKEVFSTDERWIKFMENYLRKRAAQGLNQQGGGLNQQRAPHGSMEPGTVVEFKNDPAGGKFMALFIKYILEQRLKFSANEAAMLGIALANLSRKAGVLEYQEMVYGDEASGEFRWSVQ